MVQTEIKAPEVIKRIPVETLTKEEKRKLQHEENIRKVNNDKD